ncbi:hypothetical protein Ciccas_005834 [Cichlidogyrus casuarinus]|uniref:ERAP1-like C-terminal domain-containing protein n=1 Tax=Cichlidogyrus casuarinus TaxID=1844966 RepID=A0ABD2Q8H8_9PLAT
MITLYENASMADEKVRLLTALGKARTPSLRARALKYAMTDAVRKQDRHVCMMPLLTNGPLARREFWEFVKQNISILPDKLAGHNLIRRIYKNSCIGFAHEEKLKEVDSTKIF